MKKRQRKILAEQIQHIEVVFDGFIEVWLNEILKEDKLINRYTKEWKEIDSDMLRRHCQRSAYAILAESQTSDFSKVVLQKYGQFCYILLIEETASILAEVLNDKIIASI